VRPELELVLLLFIANGTPILAKLWLGERLAWPVDGGRRLYDGYPLFGPSKTWRGLLLAPPVTAMASWLLGLGAGIGLLVGALAMAGDLLASFTKRRLGLPASSRALVLDQVPEALLPALGCMALLELHWIAIVVVVAAFTVGSLLLSVLLYRLGIRERPW
jgi:CDP-2,3-bis-(O-geranylgeranyl)-sn-glycerol synthase